MIELTYQPAFDPFHAVFRFLRLRQAILPHIQIPSEHIRVLDFYLLFPFRSDTIRVYPKHRKFKRIANQYSDARPYGDIPDDKFLFNRMSSIQMAALDTLMKKGLLNSAQYRRGLIATTSVPLPPPLQAKINETNQQQDDLLDFLLVLATEYELLGTDGLKDRSGLMEYLYDAV